ncbi:phosphotransferase enzyme family protein [Phytomonospora endophytica]|uniref:Ser/Thr protein kinase RdoA (MazF antagonist) n=1 Tax=Phytomonospora endophytica TaxID=714109 RepID=A0A841G223_9ACTN|nr:aminoglycoside phosphotransferase family protein [Phytomonospora endophytica]MBB6038200.1 Ser/Thr protein kinase RdoA (MazF antagonist) [Phytomonospora endophytica]
MATSNLEQVLEVATVGTGARVTDIVQLSGSPVSSVFRVLLTDDRAVIAKVYDPAHKYRAERERHLHTLVANSGDVAVPPLLDGNDGSTVLLFADIGLEPSTARLSQLGGLLARFHGLRPEAGLLPGGRARLRPFAEQLVSLVNSAGDLIPSEVLGVIREAAVLAPRCPQVLCHGDLHAGNVLHIPGRAPWRPVVIDFEQATIAPAEYDLARTLVITDSFGTDSRQELLSAYRPQIRPELLAPMVLFHATSGWIHAVRDGRHVRRWERRFHAARTALPSPRP